MRLSGQGAPTHDQIPARSGYPRGRTWPPRSGVSTVSAILAADLGQAPRFRQAALITQAEAALAVEAEERNRPVVLATDESHLLTGEQLEAVRMLTSHGMDYASPLTILLIGQPTLRRLLIGQPTLRRLRVGDMAALD